MIILGITITIAMAWILSDPPSWARRRDDDDDHWPPTTGGFIGSTDLINF